MVALIGHLTERRRHYPGMHAYHYNHTERSALQNLTSKHGARRGRTGASDPGRGVRRPADGRTQRDPGGR